MRRGGHEEDDAGEFYLYFVTKLKRLVLKYRDRGVPFDHYLNSTLRWNLRSYYRCRRQRQRSWRLSASPHLWGDAPCDEPRDGCSEPASDLLPDLERLGDHPVYRRRLLFLFLRGARLARWRDIEGFARLTGYDVLWLEQRVKALKERLQPKEERLRLLRDRRNRAFTRCLALESDLGREVVPGERARLRRRIGRLRRIMAETMDEMSRVPLAPTHRAIAEELGVPKGTVDTGLRWMRRFTTTGE